jgi:hypothetical protein
MHASKAFDKTDKIAIIAIEKSDGLDSLGNGIILLTFQSAGNMSWRKQKFKKIVMWGIKEGARSLTNQRDTLSNPIALDFIEKTASAASCADTLWNEKGVKLWNRTENVTPLAFGPGHVKNLAH